MSNYLNITWIVGLLPCLYQNLKKKNLFTEIQRKLEQEQHQRKSAEEKLLEVEKAKSTLSFDYKQVQQQLQSLQIDLRNESEKVGIVQQPFMVI